MANVRIKSDKITPFGGIFSIMERFDALLSETIDSTLGLRTRRNGYSYSEIFRSLMCAYLCGGSCAEDISNHLLKHLCSHPKLRTCSSDTILRAFNELATENIRYENKFGKTYQFNSAENLNRLIISLLIKTGELKKGGSYDLDFDHQFIEAEKYDANMTYKGFKGYSPGVAVIGDMVVSVENRDGNANVRFKQEETLKRVFDRLEDAGVRVDRFRADCGSYSEGVVKEVEGRCERFYIRAQNCGSLVNDIMTIRGWKLHEINGLKTELVSVTVRRWGKAYRLVIQRQKRNDGLTDLWEGEYIHRGILTNDYRSSEFEIVEYYNQRGGKERIFDEMNSGFGWSRLPKSFMAENSAFLAITALIHNFYKHIMRAEAFEQFGLNAASRVKAFVFKFVSVPAKWVRMARQHVLNIYTSNPAYASLFNKESG